MHTSKTLVASSREAGTSCNKPTWINNSSNAWYCAARAKAAAEGALDGLEAVAAAVAASLFLLRVATLGGAKAAAR